jgi:hypothetical protein
MRKRTFLTGVPPTRVRYVEYSGLFRLLLVVADVLTYVYFFGIPGYPAFPHLCPGNPIWDFFVRGFQSGMR